MQSSLQIIEEIKKDAADLQLKLLTLPGGLQSEMTAEQQNGFDKAQNGLRQWRSGELEELEKAFKE